MPASNCIAIGRRINGYRNPTHLFQTATSTFNFRVVNDFLEVGVHVGISSNTHDIVKRIAISKFTIFLDGTPPTVTLTQNAVSASLSKIEIAQHYCAVGVLGKKCPTVGR